MTLQEAMVVALDEAWVMDAQGSKLARVGNALNKLKTGIGRGKKPTSSPTPKDDQGEKSLAEHLLTCTAKTPDSCPYIKRIAKDLEESQGLDPETAMQQATQIHNNAGVESQPTDTRRGNIENLKNEADHILNSNPTPSEVDEIGSSQLPEKIIVPTPEGGVEVTTSLQQAIIENLNHHANEGDENAADAIKEIQEQIGETSTTEESSNGEQPETNGTEPPQEEISAVKNHPQEETPQKELEEYIELTKAPDDKEFRTKDGKLKVGNVKYTDVSEMGPLRAMAAAFMAGFRGEDIITGWDKMTGTWDNIKRSAKGELVRDGMVAASIRMEINECANNPELSHLAKAELANLQAMANKAKDPKEYEQVINKLKKWKKDYLGIDSSSSNSENGKLQKQMQGIHKDGGVLKSSQRIDAEGNIVEDAIPPNAPLPDPNKVLGEPGFFDAQGNLSWNDTPVINALDQKKQAIKEMMQSIGIPIAGDIEHNTSFNSTFCKIKIDSALNKRQLDELENQLAFKLGMQPHEVSVSVNNKTGELVIGLKNDVQGDVSTKQIMETDEWKNAVKTMRCPVIIGRADDGTPIIRDMKSLTHLLIAGDTGNGKSVAINTLICSMLMAKQPTELKTVMIDVKKVELPRYKDDPHQAIPVATDVESALESIQFVNTEMENRQEIISKAGCQNIDEYNAKAKENGWDSLPTMVLVIDELTELNQQSGPEFERLMHSIGNLGRASGIHIIAATQVPTKKNIGAIKDDFPSRLAFPISTIEGSRAILNDRRANEIHRKGQFIFEDSKTPKGGLQGQGAAMGHDDPRRIVSFYNNEEIKYDSEPQQPSQSEKDINGLEFQEGDTEEIQKAIESKTPIMLPSDGEDIKEFFRNTIPNDWTIEEVEENGKNYLKATPPTSTRPQSSETSQPTESSSQISSSEGQSSTQNEGSEDEDEFSLYGKPQEIIDSFASDLKKEVAKLRTKMMSASPTQRAEFQNQIQVKKQRLEDAKKAMQEGAMTGEQIFNILSPSETPPSESEQTPSETNSPSNESQASSQSVQEEEERKRSSVKPPTFYSSKGFQAVEKLTPKEEKTITETLLPQGWEFVKDNHFKAPAKTKNGVIFVKHPTNGSWGRIIPKTNKDGKIGYQFQMEVDTTHPDYKGFVQKEDGSWDLSDEGKQLESKYKRIRKYSTSKQEKEDIEKQFNRYRFGHDEAPPPQAIIGNAIAAALDRLKD